MRNKKQQKSRISGLSKNRKGQAALEFLTTYGWAFLVILVMIGALAYFGVLNPKKFIPPSCTIASPFLCEDHLITQTDVTLKIRNGNEAITVTNVSITNLDKGEDIPVDITWDICGGRICSAGQVSNLDIPITPAAGNELPSGEKQKLLIAITYYKSSSGDTYTKIAEGELIGTVQ